MAKKQSTDIVNVPVEFGNVSIGDGTISLPIKVDRDDLGIDRADELFCGRRLSAKIAAGHGDDDPQQQTMFDDMDYRIETSFDVKGFGVKPKYVRATLNAASAEIDTEVLPHFAKRQGRFAVISVSELDEDGAGDADGDSSCPKSPSGSEDES